MTHANLVYIIFCPSVSQFVDQSFVIFFGFVHILSLVLFFIKTDLYKLFCPFVHSMIFEASILIDVVIRVNNMYDSTHQCSAAVHQLQM